MPIYKNLISCDQWNKLTRRDKASFYKIFFKFAFKNSDNLYYISLLKLGFFFNLITILKMSTSWFLTLLISLTLINNNTSGVIYFIYRFSFLYLSIFFFFSNIKLGDVTRFQIRDQVKRTRECRLL